VEALASQGEKMGVDPAKLRKARLLLSPHLLDTRRSLPKDGSPACAACSLSNREVCCRREEMTV
jgi:hydroxymethylglutaryl-CoA lyase